MFDLKPFAPTHRLRKDGKKTEFNAWTTGDCKFVGKVCSKKFASAEVMNAWTHTTECKTKGNFFTFDKDGKCEYAYNGAKVSKLESKTKKGFVLTYTSAEQCKTDATKKHTVKLWATCGTEGAYTSTYSNCTTMIRGTSKGACGIFDYGKHISGIVNACKKYLGIVAIVLGVIFLWKGYEVYTWLKVILVGSVIWIVLFGIAYNVCPADKFDATTFWIMLVSTLVVAGLASYFALKVIEKVIFPLLTAYLGAVILVLLCGLVQMAKSNKVVLICAIVGFLGGGVWGHFNAKLQHFVVAYGTSFLGAYLLLSGVSSYVGGFTVTTWSIYAYFVGILILGGLLGHRQMDETVDNLGKGDGT